MQGSGVPHLTRRDALKAAAGLCGIALVAAGASTAQAAPAPSNAIKELKSGRVKVALKKVPALRKVGGVATIGNVRGVPTAVVRTGKKTYLALVHGHPDPPSGVVDAPLRMSRVSRIKIKMEAVRETDHGDGMPSRTFYEVLERSRSYALVECRPETGRQHQIRVHMCHAGHPIVGDKIYGQDESVFLRFIDTGLDDEMMETLVMPRQALHAHSIRFRHPASGDVVTLRCPLAEDIRLLLDSDG